MDAAICLICHLKVNQQMAPDTKNETSKINFVYNFPRIPLLTGATIFQWIIASYHTFIVEPENKNSGNHEAYEIIFN